MKKHIFYFNTEDGIYRNIELMLSTIIGLCIGLNANTILDIIFNNIIKISNKQYVMFIIAVVICLIVDFVVCDVPEYITDILYFIVKKASGGYTIKNNEIVNLILSVTRTINYIYILLICFFIAINILRYGEDYIEKWYNSLSTYKISENIVNKLINNDYMQYFVRKNELYNGVNMDKAMEITDDIINTAKKITTDSNKDIDKARLIYNWVGSNIKYDKNLANNITNEDIKETYGAKYAYYNRSGVCFEFATLYAAMADSIGMPVKVIVGDAFNGKEYGAHAWNEIYLEDEKRWINVDATFWGNNSSFDSDYFDYIHIKHKVAWLNTY